MITHLIRSRCSFTLLNPEYKVGLIGTECAVHHSYEVNMKVCLMVLVLMSHFPLCFPSGWAKHNVLNQTLTVGPAINTHIRTHKHTDGCACRLELKCSCIIYSSWHTHRSVSYIFWTSPFHNFCITKISILFLNLKWICLRRLHILEIISKLNYCNARLIDKNHTPHLWGRETFSLLFLLTS